MKKFTDSPEIQDLISEFLRLHKDYVMANKDDIDELVASQKTRLYKFYCKVKWNHLPNAKGVCRRCGKQLEVKK